MSHLVSVPALRPDPGPAQTWLRRELARSQYQPTLVERVQGWLSDILDRAGNNAGRLSDLGWPVLLVVLVLLVAIVALVLSRLQRNPLAPQVSGSVFDDVRRTGAEHRRLADAAFAESDWDTAVIEAVRALSAGLTRRGLAPDDPTVTAREVTALAAPRFPDLAESLEAVARSFEETRYGGRSADRARAQAGLDLEQSVRASTPGDDRAGPVLAVPR